MSDTTFKVNPYCKKSSADLYQLWEMLISRDIQAFTESDWCQIENDFLADEFWAINANWSKDPSQWLYEYPTLNEYKATWLKQSFESLSKYKAQALQNDLLNVSSLSQIKIKDNNASILKCFDGYLAQESGEKELFNWQTMYICKKVQTKWYIKGFIGYLPL
ncbi:hypothetical protein [Cysteiniphilum halobium]|uniref:hypothetical protein n=1 Tax=Cysteiniphilum halobium TaxID=2219059 RepID=UPI003F838C93